MVLIIERTLSEMRNGLINRGYLDLYFKFISKFPHVLKKRRMKARKKKIKLFRMKKKTVLNFKFSAFLLLACFRIIWPSVN